MIALDLLTRLACNDLTGEEERAVEEHVLDCTACARILEGLVIAGDAVRAMFTRAGGLVYAPATTSIVERLDAAGLITRRYLMRPGGSVACTITPNDLYSMATIEGDFHDVVRVDLTFHGRVTEDVPFEATRGRVALLAPMQLLLSLPTHRVDIKAVGYDREGRERVIGEYVMNHTAWRG